MSPHQKINPEGLAPGVGFSHVVVTEPGKTLYLGGQTAQLPDGSIGPDDLVEQFDLSLKNLVLALNAAGAGPEHLVSLQVFVTDAAEYTARLKELGKVWKKHFAKHYPAMALFEIKRLYDPRAKIELMPIAVLPLSASSTSESS
ncbi:MAG TPA: RidA family protein [Planctomycetes bacterium]|nr:RidA family protein [Planctomycetota bacterium]